MYSLKGRWNLLRAKYIVWTHSILLDKYTVGKKHIILQLWHGMPIKTIGFLEKSIPTETLNSYDYFGKNAHFFVTSDIYKQLFISIFRANPDNIHITGQPRTDLCFENNKELSSFLNVDKYKKVVLYMPTYKEALRGNKKDIDAKLENIFYMEDYNDEVFNNFIQNEDILFLLKPHPFDELNYISLRENELIPKNVKLILNLDLVGKGFHLYNLFNFADLLITDFSSIAIDFMILDKPMIFLSNLSEQYSNNRGFLFSHNCHRFMLGDSVQNFATLVRVMEKNLKEDLWKNKRKQEISLMHEYLDNNAAQRVYEVMKSLEDN